MFLWCPVFSMCSPFFLHICDSSTQFLVFLSPHSFVLFPFFHCFILRSTPSSSVTGNYHSARLPLQMCSFRCRQNSFVLSNCKVNYRVCRIPNHFTLFWASSVQSISSHSIFWSSILVLFGINTETHYFLLTFYVVSICNLTHVSYMPGLLCSTCWC
jgi:hypothetical protein